MQQDRAEAFRERVDIHVLGAAPGVGAALGLADALPVGGAIASPAEALRVYERFEQHGSRAVALLPVRGQLPGRHRERLRRQAVHAHPGENQEPRLADHQVEMLLVRALGPADPGIAAGQRAAGLAEQQAAQPAPVPVEQVIAQVRAERLAVAEVVVALDEFIPEPRLRGLLDHLQAQRLQVPQAGFDHGLGIAAAGRGRRLARTRAHVLGPLGRQRQDAGLLELLQQLQGGLDAVAAGRRAPVEVLADRLPQFLAAQRREHGHGLLDFGDLPAREAPAEEGGGLEILDVRIHDSRPETYS